MENVDVVGLIFLVGFLIIPAIGFTAAFVLHPLVEAIVRLREAFGQNPASVSEQRIASLETDLRELSNKVSRVAEGVHFHRRLESGSPS